MKLSEQLKDDPNTIRMTFGFYSDIPEDGEDYDFRLVPVGQKGKISIQEFWESAPPGAKLQFQGKVVAVKKADA